MALTREEIIRELVMGGLDERAAQTILANFGTTGNGAETSPAVPATGVAEDNPNPFPVTVYVTGGTVTEIAVNGVNTGLDAGTFRVPAGGSITLTYSVAPTWVWIAD